MPSDPVFTITYWGVTGTQSAPLRPAEVTGKLVQALRQLIEKGALANLRPGPDLDDVLQCTVERELPFHLRSTFGGNTTCVEVQTPDAHLIFDCGSGFRELGIDLEARWNQAGAAARREAHVLVSHPHMDHTFATPYFGPYYNPANSFIVWGPQVVLDSLAAVLNPLSRLSQLYFPPTYEQMKAIKAFQPIEAGADFHIGSTRITTFALHHPGGCLAFRLENAGHVFVFATDHEQQQVPDLILADFARGADLLYTEGQYLQAEYEGRESIPGDPPLSRRGWGHSPVEACVATAVAAGVRALHIGHREPRRNDAQIAQVEALAIRLLQDELARAGQPPGKCTVRIPYEGLQVQV
jgi:phosphoribosyl 1,2-cyclic phosphodiesterase